MDSPVYDPDLDTPPPPGGSDVGGKQPSKGVGKALKKTGGPTAGVDRCTRGIASTQRYLLGCLGSKLFRAAQAGIIDKLCIVNMNPDRCCAF
jgi:hypothetical protein